MELENHPTGNVLGDLQNSNLEEAWNTASEREEARLSGFSHSEKKEMENILNKAVTEQDLYEVSMQVPLSANQSYETKDPQSCRLSTAYLLQI